MKIAGFLSIVLLALPLSCAAVMHVDVMIAYDTTASRWAERNGYTIGSFAALQVEKLNEALSNSGLSSEFDFRLCGVYESSYSHSLTTAFDVLLGQVMNASAPEWQELHAARDSMAADVVSVLVDCGPGCMNPGYAAAMEPYVDNTRMWGLSFEHANEWLAFFGEKPYSLCDIASAASGYTLVHEVAHIMGAGHSENLQPNYAEPGPQLFRYSSALMYQGSDGRHYATIMGYNSSGYDTSERYTILPFFSSPNSINPYTGEPLGDTMHDNARTLRETYAIVASFRPKAKTHSEDGFTASKTIFNGAVRSGDKTSGLVQFTVAKTRNGFSKVTGYLIGLDGKKLKLVFSEKTAKYEVWFDGRISMIEVEATPKGLSEKLYAVLTTDGTILEGRLGDKTITSTVVGGMDGKSSAVFEVVERIGSIEGAQPLDQVLYDGSAYNIVPYTGHGESVSVSGGKWRVIAKAGKVKFKKNRETKQNELVVDTGKTGTQTNISSLKLSYTKKTGLFKGSFIVHCIVDGKIKKYKFTVTGLVADGAGHGQAVYKKRSLTIAVPVTVK